MNPITKLEVYGLAGLLIASLIFGAVNWAKVQHLEAAVSDSKATISDLNAKGQEREAKTQKAIADSEREKNATINALQNSLTSVATSNRLLIAQNANVRSLLPAVSNSADPTDKRICFDRSALDTAIQNYRIGVSGLVIKGGDAIPIRDGWLNWYGGQAKVK